jgi:hypothetical protein
MKKSKICNQFFIKDIYRDKKYTSTLKCACCSGIDHFSDPAPLVSQFTQWIEDFNKLHQNKGCNKVEVKGIDWAAKEINFGIAI